MKAKRSMTKKQAEAKAKKLLGDKAFIRHNPSAVVGQERASMREEFNRLRAARDEMKGKVDKKDPRYIEVSGQIDRLQSHLLTYRCEAGHIGGFTGFPLAIVSGQGDTWEEVFEKIEGRGY